MQQQEDFTFFENRIGLAEDMKFLASMPEMCDVTFLVGPEREPICAVRAILAARSTVFYKTVLIATRFLQSQKENSNWIKLRKRFSEPNLRGFKHNTKNYPPEHLVFVVKDFEPEIFRSLIEYIHTGFVTLQPRTLLGITSAAIHYSLHELEQACMTFAPGCITIDTVCGLLTSSVRYGLSKETNIMVNYFLQFVDANATQVLNLGSFVTLPQQMVMDILNRKQLKADEFTKFQAALMWAKKFVDKFPQYTLREVIGTFLGYIYFYKIPAPVLMKDIQPLDVVDQEVIVMSLAYQADPESVDLEDFEIMNDNQKRRFSDTSKLSSYDSGSTTEDEFFSDDSSQDSKKRVYVGFELSMNQFKQAEWKITSRFSEEQ